MAAQSEHEQSEHEQRVTPLELFFDLVFVFAITQVTSLLSGDPTWTGVLHGMLVLTALWWAWAAYAWLTNTVDSDEGGVRIAMLGAMAAMLVVSLAVPEAFGDHGVLFAVAYLVVRGSCTSSSMRSQASTTLSFWERCFASPRPRPSRRSCSSLQGSSRVTSGSRCGSSRSRSTSSVRPSSDAGVGGGFQWSTSPNGTR